MAALIAAFSGSLLQFILALVPLFGVLIYFLYAAWRRPEKAIYHLGDDYNEEQYSAALEETGQLIGLMDMLHVFLGLAVLWATFAMYVIVFIPKRRHLIGRYLAEGESSLGDVIYDKSSRMCGSFHDYGFAIYAHPNQKSLVRKRVRIYQSYTRERITILRLPNRPLSGQAKIDLEIDHMASTRERDSRNRGIAMVAIFWVVFTLISPIFLIHQIGLVQDMDPNENQAFARKEYIIVAGFCLPLAYGFNMIRWILYRNWLLNRGAIVENDTEARSPLGAYKNAGCSAIMSARSVDGSDLIPYSIMNESDASYIGHVQEHETNIMEGSTGDTKRPWVQI